MPTVTDEVFSHPWMPRNGTADCSQSIRPAPKLRQRPIEMEEYLGALISEYENTRPAFSGQPSRCALTRLPQLGAFLGGEFDAFLRTLSPSAREHTGGCEGNVPVA
jgi:hypothetical protein